MTPKSRSKRTTQPPIDADPVQFTACFAYRGPSSGKQNLFCEGVALDRIAGSVGTPAYVYSRASIEAAYRALDRAFGSLPHTVCYAVKANSNLAVLRVLAELGSSFDIVSGGELDRLRRSAYRAIASFFRASAKPSRRSGRHFGIPERDRAAVAF